MNTNTKTEMLFALEVMEEYRKNGKGITNDMDYAIRICESILADQIGFKTRAEWIQAMEKEVYIP